MIFVQQGFEKTKKEAAEILAFFVKVCVPRYFFLFYDQYGLWSFQTGGTKLERFLPKNQHTQRKFLNFENWTIGEPQWLAKIRVFKVDYLDFSFHVFSDFFRSNSFIFEPKVEKIDMGIFALILCH